MVMCTQSPCSAACKIREAPVCKIINMTERVQDPEKSSNIHLISVKFLGCRVVEGGVSDIELGGFLHSSGNRRWLRRRMKQVTLGFIDESFIISVRHHTDSVLYAFDLRDVNKLSVHPTRERVVGFVLNDRHSRVRRFVCFKLCRKSNMKAQELKKMYHQKLQQYHPRPKVSAKDAGTGQSGTRAACPLSQVRHMRPAETVKSPSSSSADPSKQKRSTMAKHQYGVVDRVQALPATGSVPMPAKSHPLRQHVYEPIPFNNAPVDENLPKYQYKPHLPLQNAI